MKSKLKRIAFRLLLLFTKFQYSFPKLTKTEFIHINVPYYSQWESPNLVAEFLNNKLNIKDDPEWKKSGATDKREYLHWSWNGCGMACLKMVLEYITNRKVPLVTLGKQCLKYGGYTLNKQAYESEDYWHSLTGLYYKPFVEFINKEYGLKGSIASPLVVHQIIEELSREKLVMASVNWTIRTPSVKPPKKGGHLILIIGYDLNEKMLIFHNPSGDNKATQQFVQISFNDFEKFFDNRGIVIIP